MKTKKLMSVLLSFALLVTCVTGYRTADAADTAEKILVYVAAESTVGEPVSVEKLAVFIEAGSTAKDAIKTALDRSAYKGDYVITENDWGGSLDRIGKNEMTADYSAYWNFIVNGEMASVGIGSYQLEDSDEISLIYGGYPLAISECSVYTDDDSLAPDAAAQTVLKENAKKQQTLLAQKIYETVFKNGTYIPDICDTDSLYQAFALVQSGFAADEFYNNAASKVIAQLKALQDGKTVYDENRKTVYTLDTYDNNKYAIGNYTKIALFLSAVGQDITNVAGMDLTKKITSKKLFELADPATLSRETMILLAMDAVGAQWPSGDYLTKAEIINNIVQDIDYQIVFATDISSLWGATIDSAAMAIQALAPYYDKEEAGVDQEFLKKKVDLVLGLLDHMQDQTGGYKGNTNVWELAQVMTTVGLYQMDPLTDLSVICNGKTLFDASAKFVDAEKNTVDTELLGFKPGQLLCGINSCLRSAEKSMGLYDTKTPLYKAVISEYSLPQAPVTDTTNACKKVKAAKTSYTIKKKGKTVKAVFKITEADTSKKTTDKVTAKVKDKKIAKVTKTKLAKGKLTVTVKGLKKGKTVLTVKVGKKTAKTTIKVKK